VGIIQAFNTLLLCKGTGLKGSSAVGISFTDNSKSTTRNTNVSQVRITDSLSAGLFASPLSKRTVSIGETFHTASTVKLTVRSTGIRTISILNTEVYANTSFRIAVGVRSGGTRRTIRTSTTLVSINAAVITQSITSTVGSY
jgi:hypothetical protein